MNVYKAIKQECEGLEMCLKKERGGSIIALQIANSGIRGESRGRRVTGWVLKGQGLSLFGQLGLL